MKTIGILAAALLVPSVSFAQDVNSNAEKLYDWVCSKPEGYYDVSHGGATVRTISREENMSKSNYKFRWDLHIAQIIFKGDCKESSKRGLYMGIRQYKSLLSPNSRQYTEYALTDWNVDGTLEEKTRDFQMFQSYGKGEDDEWFLLFPEYPSGFRNEDWGTLSDEEAGKLYNSELNYWAGQIDKKKN